MLNKQILNNNLLVVAEIGVNHEGDVLKAKRMIELAASVGADYIKFQSYTPRRYIAANDLTRFQRVTAFSLSIKEFECLYELALKLKIQFLSTPVTEDWVTLLNPMCSAFKIASGDITFKPVIKKAAQTGKPIIISTGAATIEEIDQAVAWVQEEVGKENIKERLILMHCVSAYPTPIEQANILSIPFLKERYGLNIGYSNHVVGINACLAAVALGACIIEVHFTDQKEGRSFRDHAISFNKDDLRNFISTAKEIKKSLGVYDKRLQPCEAENISLIRKGIVAAKNIKAGTKLSLDDLMFARPATEFQSSEIIDLIGKQINQDVSEGYLIPREAIKCVE